MPLVICISVASISWLPARTQLQAEQVKQLRLDRGKGLLEHLKTSWSRFTS
jgi:hypothetical protein